MGKGQDCFRCFRCFCDKVSYSYKKAPINQGLLYVWVKTKKLHMVNNFIPKFSCTHLSSTFHLRREITSYTFRLNGFGYA